MQSRAPVGPRCYPIRINISSIHPRGMDREIDGIEAWRRCSRDVNFFQKAGKSLQHGHESSSLACPYLRCSKRSRSRIHRCPILRQVARFPLGHLPSNRRPTLPSCPQSVAPPNLPYRFPLHVNAVSRHGESIQNAGNSDYSFGKEFTPRYAAETAIPTLESPGHIASQGETLYKFAQSGTMLIINRVSKARFRDIL